MILVLTALSTLCAAVPMLVFLSLVWWLDRYDREPIWLLGLTFAWGALGAIVLALIGSTLLLLPVAAIAPGVADATGAVVIAPLIEEPAKAFILLLIIWNKHFDNMTDGFVYGAAAGLGFGMTENFLYFASAAATGNPWNWLFTVIIRTMYSAVMHASATSVVGATLGFARFRGCLALGLLAPVGLALGMGIHGLWNGLLTMDSLAHLGGMGFGANLLFFPFEFLFVFGIYQVCLFDESLTIRRELREESAAGLIPTEHAEILGSWWRRNRRSWVPAGVDHHRYVHTATTLALRKWQLAMSRGREEAFYKREVEKLRQQVGALLHPAKA